MTKVQVRFHLRKPLDDSDYQGIAKAHAVYGIHKITVEPSLQDLMIEYDATRLRPAEVESALASAGIPIERDAAIV
ncbi:MAG: hypothetical protein JWP63_2314 [Candidatus Solibacter sp.]|jgi:hypothetical protein|nr:hypothetical protein [Candidatus Solibacter sp.]